MSTGDQGRRDELTAAEFKDLFEAVSAWGRWGPDDQRGALNYLIPARVLEAAVRLATPSAAEPSRWRPRNRPAE